MDVSVADVLWRLLSVETEPADIVRLSEEPRLSSETEELKAESAERVRLRG